MANKRVILVDCIVPEKWDFHTAVEKATGNQWEITGLQSNRYHGGVRNLLRYAQYFWLPFKIFLKKRQYASVLAWQQFYGLILAAYLRFFRAKKGPDVYAMTFIYKEKKGLSGKIYYRFVRYALQSLFLKKVFVYSLGEIQHYAKLFGVPETLFYALKLGVEDEKEKMAEALRDGEYYVAAGRSNRDYDFLRNAWNQEAQLRIICDTEAAEDTENITYLRNCHNDDYLTEMAGCRGVIIPLQDENISSGQLVLLHAMMLGKPVIMTKNNALQEYVADGQTGIIIDKTENALHEALARLNEEDTYRAISEKARAYFEQNYTFTQLGRSVGEVLATNFQ